MIYFSDNFLLGIALTLPPGPVTIEVLRRGMKYGSYESIKTAIGAFCAELTYFSLIYFGFIKITDSFLIKNILGIIGGLFLILLSYENFKDFRGKSEEKKNTNLYRNAFLSGYVVTFFNPSNFFMWAGIISVFFAQNTSLLTSSAVLVGIFISLFTYAIFSRIGRIWIGSDKMRYISLFSSAFLLFYGLKLIIDLIW